MEGHDIERKRGCCVGVGEDSVSVLILECSVVFLLMGSATLPFPNQRGKLQPSFQHGLLGNCIKVCSPNFQSGNLRIILAQK